MLIILLLVFLAFIGFSIWVAIDVRQALNSFPIIVQARLDYKVFKRGFYFLVFVTTTTCAFTVYLICAGENLW